MRKFLILPLLALLFSCSSSPSIQQYFVEKSEEPSFLLVDIPTSVLGVEEAILSDEEKEALASFQKLNLLLFRKTEANATQFQDELKAVEAILDDQRFDPLFILNDTAYTGKLLLQGSVQRPDELIFFGSANEGFVVVRLIGRKMQVEKVVLLATALQREGAFKNAAETLEGMF
jgi:hypothetical protein